MECCTELLKIYMACGYTYSNDLEPTASSSSSPFAHSIQTPSTSYSIYGTSSDPRANMGVLKTNASYTMAREPIYGDRVRCAVEGGTIASQRTSYARRSMREVSTRSMYGTPPPSTSCTDCDCESSEYSRSNSRASSVHRQMAFNGNSPKLIIPSRASCNERKQNMMVSKPASLVTKVTKVIKKIQRKIGIGKKSIYFVLILINLFYFLVVAVRVSIYCSTTYLDFINF